MKTFTDFRIELPRTASGEVDVVCPECSHTRKKKHAKCLGVNIEKGTWMCQHCGWSGGLLQGGRKGEIEHWRKPVYIRPQAKSIDPSLDAGMRDWFAARGIPEAVLIRNKISTQVVWMPQVEERVKSIAFPYYRDNELINVKYRDHEKNFRMEAGAERVLYGLNDIDSARCVIVEGECDKLAVEVAGITSCVSVPDGAPPINAKNYTSKFSYLDCDEVAAVREWIIAVDNDAPGTRLEQELVRRFGVESCKRVTWPRDCKDANEVLMKYDVEGLRKCIYHAQEFPITGVIYVSELQKEIELLYTDGSIRGVSTGWPAFDKFFTVKSGELTVITGTPGSGKSNWLDALLVNLARLHSWTTAVFSPENQPLHQHAARLMEKFARQPFRDGLTPRMTPARRDEALQWCSHFFPFIAPDDDAQWTLDNILVIAQSLVKRHGIKALVIDPWNELEHQRPSHLSETEHVGVSLKRLRQFARKHDVHIFLVAHPAKLYRDKRTGEIPVPSLYDISGSANFYNKVDNGLIIWRDKNNDAAPVEVHVQKIRFRETGQLGVMPFKYNRVIADYEELAGPKTQRRVAPSPDARLPPERDDDDTEVVEL